MHFLKNKKIVSSMFFAVAMFLVLVFASVVFFNTKAWFSSNKNTASDGMQISAATDKITFGDTLTAKAVMNNIEVASGTYKKDSNSTSGANYFLLKSGSDTEYELDEDGNKKPLSYNSLYPGEYIEISVNFTCSDSLIGTNYKLFFSGLTDSDTFTYNEKEYSVLGVYKVSVVNSDGTEEDKGFLSDYDDPENVNDSFIITTGTFAEGVNTATFRLTIDLTQYKTLSGVATNTLSEKTVSINRLVLGGA